MFRAQAPRPDSQAKRHLCTAAVASPGAGDVIVVSHRGGTLAAGWGGLLSLAAAQRGIEGTLVDGPTQDIDECWELGYAVFSTAVTPTTARGRLVELDWNKSIRFTGVPISAGGLVRADGSGITFIAQADADEVVGVAEQLAERESAMSAAVRSGRLVTEVMGASYESPTAQARRSQ